MLSPATFRYRAMALSCQRGRDNIQRFTELHFGDGKRIKEANNVAVYTATQQQQAFLQCTLLNLTGKVR